MFKKKVLIALTSVEVLATSIAMVYAVAGNNVLSVKGGNESNYTFVIDKDHPLINCEVTNGRAFRLTTGQYGYFGMSSQQTASWLNTNPGGDYADYAFSYNPTEDNSAYLQIVFSSFQTSGKINGERIWMYGFPGATKVTTVYTTDSPDADFDACYPGTGWNQPTKTVDGNLITEVSTRKSGQSSYAYAMDWSLRKPGSVYFKSITIEYTC